MFNGVQKMIKRLGQDEKGASAVEYAVMVAAIGAALYTGAQAFGSELSNKLMNVLSFG